MYTHSNALFLYAHTSVHLGSGQALGAVDLAIQRERYTDLPMGASSGIKGAARAWFARRHGAQDDRLLAAFGPETDAASDHAGAVAFTDARLLLFPVRSLRGVFVWATAPVVLDRFRRDLALVGMQAPAVPYDALEDGTALGGTTDHAATFDGRLVLDEAVFRYYRNPAVEELARWLVAHALPQGEAAAAWAGRLERHLVVLPDDDFLDFARHATEVRARIKLNEKKTTTGGGGNLFYQENLPADALLYTLAMAQDDRSGQLDAGGAEDLLGYVRELDGQPLQIGGGESVGYGLMTARFASSTS